ncbi:MAG: hypothetical protein ABS45_04175 [Comamonas sp. SCN 65-56]|uniref:DUF3293 domain-containing protein n=1 Tax=Comamonas sp. SCN 65-56 TaxID=1660095 RepID=UPI00086E183B|nr:DUF3293 domain-containing protein [Comamonas sp. SCN 65-56]ODS93094.1 MAG: hypothetical protein ABS45_04175 [Comamonas sp. SCN 65-56]
MTAIPAELLAAYRETEYRVGGDAPFILRINQASPLLRQLHSRHGVTSSAFITAANPRSQPCTLAFNTERQQQLAAELRRLHLLFIEGEGTHPSNGWPPEPSFLVLGLTRATAERLGHRWAQNAIVVCAEDTIPQLLLLTCGQPG